MISCKVRTITLFFALMMACTSAGPVFSAGFESYKLDNGMEIALREAHANPMVACVVVIGAGAYGEAPGQSGASHMLEHLLFDGTSRRSREEITEAQRRIGGYFNAFTRKDYTAFLFLVPSENLEQALDILDDMLFHSILSSEEVEKERKVVSEEINKDMSTLNYKIEKFSDKVFFGGTPYALPTLGEKNVIATITRDEIMDYYRKMYNASNMRAVFVGDFDSETLKGLVDRYFGIENYSKLPEVESSIRFERNNKTYTKHMRAKNTHVLINIQAPRLTSEEYYPFELLCRAQNRPVSLLNRFMRADTSLGILESDLVYEHHRGFSSATLRISARSNNVKRIVSRALEALRKASTDPSSKETLEAVKTALVTEEMYNEEKFHYFVMYAAEDMALGGTGFLNQKIDKFQKARVKDLEKVARKYFRKPAYKVAAVVPAIEGKGSGASQKHHSTFEAWKTPNGKKVIAKYNRDSRVFAVHLLLKNRLACEPSGKEGITEVLSRMLLKGAGGMNEAELDNALQKIGAEIELTDNPFIPYDDYRTKPDYSFIRFLTIDSYYERGLELLKKILFEADLPEGALNQVKSEINAMIARRESTPYKRARRIFFEKLLEGSPFMHDVLGDASSIESITVDDLRDYYRSYFSPGNIIMTVASNIPPRELKEKINGLFGNVEAGPMHCKYQSPKPVSGIVEVEEKIDAPQISIYMGNLLGDVPREDVVSLSVMNGLLSRRLAEELREKRGLAYSIGSSLYFGKEFTYLVISMGTEPKNLDAAKKGIMDVMRKMTDDVSEEEVTSYKNSSRGRMLMRRLARINQAYYMGINEYRGFGYDFDDAFTRALRDVDAEAVKRAAGLYLPVSNHVTAIAGPLE